MDSITQGVLGAAAAQSVMMKRLPRGVGWIGAIGGMAADLDVFIRSSSDPTVSWLFHRHFTHSLIFIPLGGLIAAIPFLVMKRFKDCKREVVMASIIGYATHAPLDMFTSYGTQLFWPFTNLRVALDWIAIIDPVYTIPLWIGVIWSAKTKNPRFARAVLLATTLYIVCFGAWQHHRAAETQAALAAVRGARVERWRVMPVPGWLVLWRSVYVADGRLHADAIRTPWFGAALVLEGGSADVTTIDDLPAAAQTNPESKRRFEILDWFADGMLAPVNGDPHAIGDMRLTIAPESMTPLWGLQFDPSSGAAPAWHPPATAIRDYPGLLRGLFFNNARYKPVEALRATSKNKAAQR